MKKYVIEYDSEADAAYIRVAKKAKIKDTIEISKGVFADVDKKNKFVGIEILNFSRKKTNMNELISKELDSIAVAN
ncbi:MAG: DUF2283 domain-containing protein [Candidatus Micrarchaeota archaeon]|nr:DUF2283 domain-containing protein [Candidatus Micrarchaeota archaeon]